MTELPGSDVLLSLPVTHVIGDSTKNITIINKYFSTNRIMSIYASIFHTKLVTKLYKISRYAISHHIISTKL